MPKAQIKLKPDLKIIREEEIPHLLVPGEVGAVLELTVKDKDGKVTEKRVLKSRSFVRQFLELLWVKFLRLPLKAPLLMKDTSSFARDIYNKIETFASDGGVGVVTHGIIVGTGTGGPTIDDYALETPIAHGTGAGPPKEIQYGAVTFGAPASDTTTSQFTITRNFSNNCGAEITVNEIGLYVEGYDTGDITRYFMIIRDVIDPGIVVGDGQTLTVNYREQVVR